MINVRLMEGTVYTAELDRDDAIDILAEHVTEDEVDSRIFGMENVSRGIRLYLNILSDKQLGDLILDHVNNDDFDLIDAVKTYFDAGDPEEDAWNVEVTDA